MIIGVLVLVLGFGGGYLVRDSQSPSMGNHMMSGGNMMEDHAMGGMGNAMDDMMEGLKGKQGDDFDKAFLLEMIMHHQGAVEMAQAALKNAGHQEIKTMAHAIISAQTSEISQMQQWQKSWYQIQ